MATPSKGKPNRRPGTSHLGPGTEEDTAFDQELQDLKRAAKEAGRSDVLDSFNRYYLVKFVRQSQGTLSPERMVQRLKAAVDAYDVIHDLERRMDKKYFVDLVTGGCFLRCGTERTTKAPMSWMHTAEIYKGCWRLRNNSPQACALTRALLWQCETTHAQLCRNSGSLQGSPLVYCVLELGRGMLDFHVGAITQVVQLTSAIFPVEDETIYVGGASKVSNVGFKLAKALLGPRWNRINMMDSLEDVCDMVESKRDIPEFWFADGSGKPYCATDRRNIWCYERCLTDENKVTLKDVLNPPPWEHEEDALDGAAANTGGDDGGALDPIAEGDEDE